MRFRTYIGLFVVAGLFSIATGHAAVPGLINLQGVLTDSSGNPMPNTGYGVTFRIYTAAAGGTVLWTEETAVYTLNGLFTVVLGTQTPVPDTAFNNPDRWLGIQMDDYPEMTPRSRLTSVAYANQTAQWNSDGQDLYRLNGNIGIGTNAPEAPLHVMSNSESIAVFERNTGGFISVLGSDGYAKGIFFGDSVNAQRGGIDFDGISNGYGLGFRVNGNFYPSMRLGANGDLEVAGCVDGNNTACTSDKRFKTNIETLDDALITVKHLRGVSFSWRRDEFPNRNFEAGVQTGVIAQEVQDVLPGSIRERADGYLAVEYNTLIPVLIEAIKEQQERIEALEKKLEQQAP